MIIATGTITVVLITRLLSKLTLDHAMSGKGMLGKGIAIPLPSIPLRPVQQHQESLLDLSPVKVLTKLPAWHERR